VPEAAVVAGKTVDAMRKRVIRGQLPSRKEEKGRVRVFVPKETLVSSEAASAKCLELVARLRAGPELAPRFPL
jgi:hypothetical protein